MAVELVSVEVERLPHAEGLSLPEYATEHSAGLDLRAAVPDNAPVVLGPAERALIPTGLRIALPIGFEGQVRPRSGLALRHGITLLNSPGTIDADYRGEVKVILTGNNEPFVMQQSHAFEDECRGLGVAEMAWSMRMGRKNRANKEMAYHALEVLHRLVKSSETMANQVVQSTFEKTPPIPRGYSGQTHFEFMEEIGVAL